MIFYDPTQPPTDSDVFDEHMRTLERLLVDFVYDYGGEDRNVKALRKLVFKTKAQREQVKA